MKQLILSLLTLLPLATFSQEQADTVVIADTMKQDTIVVADTMEQDTVAKLNRRIEQYEKRIARSHRVWMALLPSFYRLQYAGSIGLVNLGVGWEYGKHRQWETDLMFGFVPKYDKDDAFVTFTLRQTYVPWTKGLYRTHERDGGRHWFTWQPLSCGLFLNSVLSKDYWTKEPERYPDRDYYRFSSKIRFHLFVGQRYTIHIPKEKRFLAKECSFVWELSTCDLYVVSKFVNGSIPLKDILSLSLGLKMKI